MEQDEDSDPPPDKPCSRNRRSKQTGAGLKGTGKKGMYSALGVNHENINQFYKSGGVAWKVHSHINKIKEQFFLLVFTNFLNIYLPSAAGLLSFLSLFPATINSPVKREYFYIAGYSYMIIGRYNYNLYFNFLIDSNF